MPVKRSSSHHHRKKRKITSSLLLKAASILQKHYPDDEEIQRLAKSQNEYRLIAQPASLKEFWDLFADKKNRQEEVDLIWITTQAFVASSRMGSDLSDRVQSDSHFTIRCDEMWERSLYIYSKSRTEAARCLNNLFQLSDSCFTVMSISYLQGRDEESFDDDELWQNAVLQNPARQHYFRKLHFSSEQSRLLATAGKSTNIEFAYCSFEDGGDAFWQARRERSDENAGPACIGFVRHFPFQLGNSLNNHSSFTFLDSLTLKEIQLDIQQCGAIAAAEVQYLKLENCRLADGGEALVEAARGRRGPRGLCIQSKSETDWEPFDSYNRLICLIEALPANDHLERFELEFPAYDDGELAYALAANLRGNRTLRYLGCDSMLFSLESLKEFLEVVSTHPSLSTLDLGNCYLLEDEDNDDRDAAYQAIGDMLQVNHVLQEIKVRLFVDEAPFWKARINPKLEWNQYQERCSKFQEITESSKRAGLVARALARFEHNPLMIWSLLSHNGDVILDGYLLSNSAPSQIVDDA